MVVYPAKINQVAVTEGNAVFTFMSQFRVRDSRPIIRSTELMTPKPGLKTFRKMIAMAALEIMKALEGTTFSAEVDEILKKVVFALEEFNCESALINLKQTEEILGG